MPHPSSAARRATVAVDVAILSVQEDALATLLTRRADRPRDQRALPWGAPAPGETLEAAAARITASALGRAARWIEQLGAYGDAGSHPGGAEISIAFVAVAEPGAARPDQRGAEWRRLDALPTLPARHRRIIAAALEGVRARIHRAPVAFHLLPAAFTLSELQRVYELLLGRRLHKASFRRALDAAALVEPLREWRSEGRGRPAQLYRYAPRTRRSARRSVRFELLAS